MGRTDSNTVDLNQDKDVIGPLAEGGGAGVYQGPWSVSGSLTHHLGQPQGSSVAKMTAS